MKEMFAKRFKELYPKHRLLAIQLNGFSHKVFMDEGNKESEITSQAYSGYAPEIKTDTFNTLESIALFKNIGNIEYSKGSAEEIIWLLPDER